MLLSCTRNASEEYVCEPFVRKVHIQIPATKLKELASAVIVSSPLVDNDTIKAISGASRGSKVQDAVMQQIKSGTNGADAQPKLLTMFTTMKDIDLRERIHANTLLNWAALSPYLSPILFAPNSRTTDRWSRLASRLGWETIPISETINDVPILKWMFRIIERRGYQTPFVGYANADILFDGELLRTLLGVLGTYDDLDKRMILITGRRRNVNVHLLPDATCLACIRKIALGAQLYQTDAEDYFIFSRAGFPWNDVPEFVVGSPGYDNWLVAKALQWGVTVVDASRTINAVHQIGAEGVKSGWDFNLNPFVNLRLVSSNFRYEMGKTSCALQRTVYSYAGCASSFGYCVKIVPSNPAEIPYDCKEPLLLSTESFLDQMLGHDY